MARIGKIDTQYVEGIMSTLERRLDLTRLQAKDKNDIITKSNAEACLTLISEVNRHIRRERATDV